MSHALLKSSRLLPAYGGQAVRASMRVLHQKGEHPPDPEAANEAAFVKLRTLQIDEAEAARPGGGQDELNAVEKAVGDEPIAAEKAGDAAGAESMHKPDPTDVPSQGMDNDFARTREFPKKNKRLEPFPLHTSVRHAP